MQLCCFSTAARKLFYILYEMLTVFHRVSVSLVSPLPSTLFIFFAVAVTVVVTNLPVNFAVDLAGAMRQGRKHLFHLARTHKQADTHKERKREDERGRESTQNNAKS